jgi:hypothetical protein
MPQPPFANKSGNVIRDQDAARVCNLAGITAARRKIVRLSEARDGLIIAMRELEAQKRKDDILAKTLLALKFTKATCDAFIGLAAELSKAVLPKAVATNARLVKGAYGITSSLAEAAGTAIAGDRVDVTKTAAAVTKAGGDLIDDAGYRYLLKNTGVKIELFNNAMNGDSKGLRKSAIDYMSDLAKFSLDVLEQKKASVFLGIAKQTFDYNEKLASAFDELIAYREADDMRLFSAKMQLIKSGRQIEKNIRTMEDFIASCEAVPVRLP